MMKPLIAALALVTLFASPTFALAAPSAATPFLRLLVDVALWARLGRADHRWNVRSLG
jgi:hypothetical protein